MSANEAIRRFADARRSILQPGNQQAGARTIVSPAPQCNHIPHKSIPLLRPLHSRSPGPTSTIFTHTPIRSLPTTANMALGVSAPEDLIGESLKVAGQAFNETLYFLLAALVVGFGACFVGYLLVKTIDRDAAPFIAWSPEWFQPLPLIASGFVGLSLLVQLTNTCIQFWSAHGEIKLANVALTNMVASLGMEGAFLVVFGGLNVLAMVMNGATADETIRARRSVRKE
ncbi:hypothetical protein BAUCODRAFT_432663 [Baudoinia panamericana UAMH 10762]|uniref:Uncharacterized protein n=1 Tax=Baudoinia panamericana (strain UAMH 10762) TaxID=717646 RepID=M2NDB9_BAUPA|nr:uncharacterized protein BAUCODRAFT_432663 [Baudoinia panamericana UAMH 10762]EMC96915.1 hypothetical protein BAUCODRAFT_432663 [Baudoinia panamericana UAMH 10762]